MNRPGWYPDTADYQFQLYWDGARFTGGRRPLPTPRYHRDVTVEWIRQPWVIIIAAVLGLFFIVTVAGIANYHTKAWHACVDNIGYLENYRPTGPGIWGHDAIKRYCSSAENVGMPG
jgi:hypothetical protein